jgi:formylglycine-generating enzyme required for sulfatase activity
MRMIDPEVRGYVDSALPFRVKPPLAGRQRPIRVARTLLTCGLAAKVLNEMGVMPETESAYLFVNVHNPAHVLTCAGVTRQWSCSAGHEGHPAWGINWAGAALICRHLGARLPWADEWTAFASNNDPHRRYPWGNEPPTEALANFGEHVGGTSAVGSFPGSELGLYDLAGNLDEWCGDPDERNPFERVVRGGAWSKDAQYLAIAARRSKWARLGTTTIGFRPVWDD